MLGERGAPGCENKGPFMGDLSIMCDLTLVKTHKIESIPTDEQPLYIAKYPELFISNYT